MGKLTEWLLRFANAVGPVCKILHGDNPLIDTPMDVYYVYVQIAVCSAVFVSQQEVQPPNIFLAEYRT